MSIIIKGINILPYCEGLIFTDHSTVLWADDDMQIHEYEVIQIPEGHGRIGDLDKVKRKGVDDGYDFYVSWTDIDNEPTILEAEE